MCECVEGECVRVCGGSGVCESVWRSATLPRHLVPLQKISPSLPRPLSLALSISDVSSSVWGLGFRWSVQGFGGLGARLTRDARDVDEAVLRQIHVRRDCHLVVFRVSGFGFRVEIKYQ